ncbi:hypothetical protein L1080_027785 [Rhodococcus sp. MSC1_016]|jgi:hypothetical protein|uniref:hypothetical protein n=1 Tax=Rhodococcus sp. MSC1_016 TaxID=2909266 RepID=UPI00202E2B43|nr:hypothetical protein [Rhodococcus sp. MSC1_016]
MFSRTPGLLPPDPPAHGSGPLLTTTIIIGICVLVVPMIAVFVLGAIGDRRAEHADPEQVAELRRRLSAISDKPLPPPDEDGEDGRTEPPPRWIEH